MFVFYIRTKNRFSSTLVGKSFNNIIIRSSLSNFTFNCKYCKIVQPISYQWRISGGRGDGVIATIVILILSDISQIQIIYRTEYYKTIFPVKLKLNKFIVLLNYRFSKINFQLNKYICYIFKSPLPKNETRDGLVLRV